MTTIPVFSYKYNYNTSNLFTVCRNLLREDLVHLIMSKLHPVYVALDSHQYSRAIKLSSALPPSNVLGRALLSHAYWKNGQSNSALEVIHSTLNWGLEDATQNDVLDVLAAEASSIDWNTLPSNPCPQGLADETTLETFGVTLEGMKRADLIFKLYGWVGQQHAGMRLYTLPKQYMAGLHVLCSSKRNDSILASMQAIAFQLSRMVPVYTPWAARTAMWQWKFAQDVDDIRIQMLPRLAESLAKKAVQLEGSSIEDCLLWMEILEAQQKWQDLLDILPQLKKLPLIQSEKMKATCFKKLERWSEAQDVYIKMINDHPDQWANWKSLIECAVNHGGYEEAQRVAQELVTKHRVTGKPTRSIELVACELTKVGLKHGKSLEDLAGNVKEYGNTFCSGASCTFSDIESLLELIADSGNTASLESLFDWADGLRASNSQGEGEEDRAKLRSFIFAVQVLQKLGKKVPEKQMPTWQSLAKAWTAFPAKQGAQKENQPSDELVLLAVEEMLGPESTAENIVAALTLLEMALKKSSYNPSLKLRMIDLYSKLHAYDNCWTLFRDVGVKHIQCDSVTFAILPLALKGGLYNKALQTANETMKFHNGTLRDSGEYTNRAMESGTWSKADEFLNFQRNRLNNSLALMEAKGVIMDTAPLMHGSEIGSGYGIVGNQETDMERAQQVLDEVWYANGSPSLLMQKDFENLSDNRDFSVLPSDSTSVVSKEQIISETKRRIFFHGLLVRLATVVDVAKGPKKGKIAKPSEPLIGRCQHVLSFLDDSPEPTDGWINTSKMLVKAIILLNSGLPKIDGDDNLKTREEQATELIKKATKCTKELPSEWLPEAVGRVIPDSVIPMFAVFRMTATIFARFGWGKRKQRESVSSLSEFALAFKTVMESMVGCFESFADISLNVPEECVLVLDMEEWTNMVDRIIMSRKEMKTRIGDILKVVVEELETFRT